MAFRACRTTEPESDGFSDGCEAALRGTHSQAALGNDGKNIFRRIARFLRESAIIPLAISISMGARLSGGPPNTTPDNGKE